MRAQRRLIGVATVIATGLSVGAAPLPNEAAADATGHPAAANNVTMTTPKSSVPQGEVASIIVRSARARSCRLRTLSPTGRRNGYRLALPGASSLVSFRVAQMARRGAWRLTATCGRKFTRARLRVKGRPGARRMSLLVRSSIVAKPLDHGPLDASVIPAELERVEPGDRGGPDPDFKLPFPCQEDWTASTYPGHGHSTDWNAPGEDGGRSVVASADGVAHPQPFGKWNGGFGNYVLVVHGGGWTTLYAHLSAYSVSAGQEVKRGQEIGRIGTTGNSDGNHLHYEQRLSGIPQPQRFSGATVRMDAYKSDNCVTVIHNPQQTGNPQPGTANPQPPTGNPQGPQPEPGGGSPPPPPPSPSVSISKGASAQGRPGCSSSSCQYVTVSFANFSAAEHTVTCHASHGEEGGFYTYRRAGGSDTSSVCYFGYPGRTVWVTVDGVRSNDLGW